ncbi:MAG TPA: hypothetical protein VFM68_03575, partial [Candidatus Saccharimonadales bacterium]|nr:hypothetical protein [Candidatus Saccharimonadales bacterium]
RPVSPPDTTHKKASPTIKKTSRPSDKAVEINIVIPRFTDWYRPHIASIRRRVTTLPRKTKLISSALIAIALITLGGYYWLNSSGTTATTPESVDAQPDLVQGTPDHKIILPQGKTIESFAGSTWVSPPDRPPVFVYVDTIGSAAINVSQQPLPDTFQPDVENKIAQVAASFQASEKVTVGSSIVHIGTTDSGSQSLIFHKDTLLVSITSKVKIKTSQWVRYINSLQ